ncbi:MAG TPA: hypothetical protein VFG86_07295 [Chloroflexota bacterium]|nr:hypothetical protein [Chloroflexota bacterium]
MAIGVMSDRRHVLVLEPNSPLRRAIHELLTAEDYEVIECDSLEQVLRYAASTSQPLPVGLVAWQSMDGMLADAHRHRLVQLTDHLRLVLMVPRRWKRLLEQSDLDFLGMVAKPFDADELLEALSVAFVRAPVATWR